MRVRSMLLATAIILMPVTLTSVANTPGVPFPAVNVLMPVIRTVEVEIPHWSVKPTSIRADWTEASWSWRVGNASATTMPSHARPARARVGQRSRAQVRRIVQRGNATPARVSSKCLGMKMAARVVNHIGGPLEILSDVESTLGSYALSGVDSAAVYLLSQALVTSICEGREMSHGEASYAINRLLPFPTFGFGPGDWLAKQWDKIDTCFSHGYVFYSQRDDAPLSNYQRKEKWMATYCKDVPNWRQSAG